MQSRTVTQTQPNGTQQAVLHLRPADENQQISAENESSESTRPRVRWTTDVVDNENMNKKKLKICCIFHPQREFGESSDELCSSSSSDSSDESDMEAGAGNSGGQGENSGHEDHSEHCCGHKPRKGKKSAKTAKQVKKPASPNAYERQPQYKNRSTLPDKAI
ncbi:hypothetical protein HF325_003219 [Metschnikowia pulcherrima]|uniref:Type 1 phosphatases regulator n=1 Tax=Metschnikowia pulcherrima TaxID=27326 RepID=A0A8H7GTI5_9ASCO|nr:hypothetical protein HF325_003219 [Metschnikowia pulcherrima]